MKYLNSSIGYTYAPFNRKYIFPNESYQPFQAMLMTGTYLTNLKQIFGSNNNSQYVNSIRIYPFNPESFFGSVGSAQSTLSIGDTTISATTDYPWTVKPAVSPKPYLELCEITFPRYYNNFLDKAPYTKAKLYIPSFNFIDLPVDLILLDTYHESPQFKVLVSCDFDTGDGMIFIGCYNSSGELFIASQVKAQFGFDIPLGTDNNQELKRNQILNGISILGSAITTAIGVASGNALAVGGGVALATNSIKNYLQSDIKSLSTSAQSSGLMSLVTANTCFLYVERPRIADTTNYASLYGKPLMESRTLSSLSGMTIVDDIHLEDMSTNLSPLKDEVEEIENQLKSGVIL